MNFSGKLAHNLLPSELNSRFDYGKLNFSAYIEAVIQMMRAVNKKFSLNVSDEKLLLNAPFEWRPKEKTCKGALLIHGLFDTPFIMRDVGRHLFDKGFLVRSILLPGHGSVPADLLTTSSKEWIKATDYGVQSFKEEVDELYLVGFSTGATLSINYVLRNLAAAPRISGMIMLSPALAINTLKNFLIRFYRMFRWLFKENKWILCPDHQDYTKYTSFPVNAALMLQRLIVENHWLKKKSRPHIPLFMALSENDESVRPQIALHFFNKTSNPKNRLIYYSNTKSNLSDPRIQVVPTFEANAHILDYSHVCIPVSPDNPHYGQYGDHKEPIREPDHKVDTRAVYYGAYDSENEKKYRLCRLTYNPKFNDLMQAIDRFIEATSCS